MSLTVVETFGLPFLVSAPDRPGGDQLLPLLCFLHGFREGSPTGINEGLLAHGPLKPGNPPFVTETFLIVAPQLPEQGDIWRMHQKAVEEIVKHVQTAFHGDPCRTYLTGFSFGGNGVFDLAAVNPLLWAALWPVDPVRVPLEDRGLPIWLSAGEASRYSLGRFLTRLDLEKPGKGSPDRVYTDEGLDHVGTATSAYRNIDIYHWLLSKKRSLFSEALRS